MSIECAELVAIMERHSHSRTAHVPELLWPRRSAVLHRAGPRYLYMSHRHQEALAHLLYGVNGSGGFVLLTGEVGPARPQYAAVCSSRSQNPAM